MQFITDVTDVDIYGRDEDNCSCSSATVKWSCDIEAREWGIKDIAVYAFLVECYILIQEWNEQLGEYGEENELQINSGDGWNLESEGLDNNHISDSIRPESISIDFETKTITVNF